MKGTAAPGYKKKPLKAGLSTALTLWKMAGVTGLEPAASGVTGRRSNQLSYTPSRGREVVDQAPISVKHQHQPKSLFFCMLATGTPADRPAAMMT